MDDRKTTVTVKAKAKSKVPVKAKAKPKNKVVLFETLLRCKLSNEELIARGTEMADASAEVVTFEDQLSAVKKEYQAKIDSRKARINELSGTIRAKAEQRSVKCKREFCYSAGKVEERRLDTREVINTRKINIDECQAELAV